MKLIRPNNQYIQGYIEANEEDEMFRPNAERRFNHPETIVELSLIHISEPTRPY